MTPERKRLIEVSLPLAEISAQSAREKSIRHGHISTLHIWWARRPLAAMRAAIFAALILAPETDEERERLERLIATIVDWDQVKGGNSEAIKQAQALIRQAFPDRPPRLLDPFMGGGATGLEALAQREALAWRDVDALIQEGQAKPYEKAVGLLSRLKELAEYRGQEAAFQERLNRIYDQYARRTALLRRMRNAGLTEG
jgi:hypothetical protein